MVSKQLARVILFSLLLFGACQKNSTGPEMPERGDLISSAPTGDMSLSIITPLLSVLAGNAYPAPVHPVSAYRLVYSSEDIHGNPMELSGTLLVPDVDGASPLFSMQHGTETCRTRVASSDPFVTLEGTAAVYFASLGYVTVMADYPGLGVSEAMHPYVHGRSLAMACVDLLRAARSFCRSHEISLLDQTFLGGYSEGGYATLALQKELETRHSLEFDLTAVAPMAGPYDLLSTADSLLAHPEEGNTVYLAFLLTAYHSVYGWNRLDEIFVSPYDDQVAVLFDGSHEYGEIAEALPDRLDDLLLPQFIEHYQNDGELDLKQALADNTLLGWSPQAPIHLVHGDADMTVPYFNSERARADLSSRTASSVDLITVSGGDHLSSAIPAYLEMIRWFREIRASGLE